jgi:hypothetical protein
LLGLFAEQKRLTAECAEHAEPINDLRVLGVLCGERLFDRARAQQDHFVL